ncbi:hypothetical protein [Senegalia massiliensis]|uniref:Uncharacterized protein n=1 Tax=Senegalia massiliensis TaxID=1720316 RepID=A0A845R273_9CLOT|nr:hypothetical protein [Senegalia massiliensis]NBI08079.1 hypothetical protein [Senegalia massiliensis]
MGVYDALKDAVNIAQKADNVELYRALLDVQKESLDLLEENKNLKEKIKELKDNTEISKSLIFKNNSYYKKDDIEYKEPYCSNCWDNNQKLIRMHLRNIYPGTLTAICNTCKTSTRTGESYNI